MIETSRAVLHREGKATGLEATRRLSTFFRFSAPDAVLTVPDRESRRRGHRTCRTDALSNKRTDEGARCEE